MILEDAIWGSPKSVTTFQKFKAFWCKKEEIVFSSLFTEFNLIFWWRKRHKPEADI